MAGGGRGWPESEKEYDDRRGELATLRSIEGLPKQFLPVKRSGRRGASVGGLCLARGGLQRRRHGEVERCCGVSSSVSWRGGGERRRKGEQVGEDEDESWWRGPEIKREERGGSRGADGAGRGGHRDGTCLSRAPRGRCHRGEKDASVETVRQGEVGWAETVLVEREGEGKSWAAAGLKGRAGPGLAQVLFFFPVFFLFSKPFLFLFLFKTI